jgi:hypothetical protein
MTLASTLRPDHSINGEPMRRARTQMRAQISRLERELSRSELDCARAALGREADRRGGPRIAGLEELERQRDALIDTLARARFISEHVQMRHAAMRRELQAMLADPAKFKFARISNSQMGLPSCKTYEVRPVLGPVGMLAGWWRVKISSGCP